MADSDERFPSFPTAAMLADLGDPPEGTPVTAEEYARTVTEFAREWVDGRLRYLPFATESERFAAVALLDALRSAVRRVGGVVTFKKFHVRTPGGFRSPDVLALLDATDSRRGPDPARARWWEGADIVMEVVPASDPDRVLTEKRRDYAAAGALEYWIVDPRPGHRRVAVLTLAGGVYRGEFVGEGGDVESRLLPGFAVPVADVLESD